MTFKKFEELFHQKYPDGEVWMHDEFEHGQRGTRQKVAVVFAPRGKVYMYAEAYEDILRRIGMKVISKQRFAEAERHLETLKQRNGKPGFFGGVVDTTEEIKQCEARIADYKANWIIA